MKIFNSKDARYIKEFKRWFDKLPKKQKAIMKTQGLDKPHLDDYTTKQKFDVSEFQIADTSVPYSEVPEEKLYTQNDMRKGFEKILHEIVSKKNPKLNAVCLQYILGSSPYQSEQQIADEFKMTRANVSAICIELKDKFGIEKTLYGHNPTTRDKYQSRACSVVSKFASDYTKIKNEIKNCKKE